MFAFINNFVLLFAESHNSTGGGFMEGYNHFFNIPGFEAWKFINLGIFIAFMIYVLRKPLSSSFKEKRDAIRADLIRAEAEKQDAMSKLTGIEGKLAQVSTEKIGILEKAKAEAQSEKDRLADQTANDVSRLKQQTDAELARLATQSRALLRRFSAEESIRLAEEKLRSQIDAASDSRLVKAGIQEIGGLN